MIVLRDYQVERMVNPVRQALVDGFRAPLLVAPTGSGKCLAPGTPVLMFNGIIKPVEDVVVGDWLMGPDSKPRVVKSVTSGTDQMFRVRPVKGAPFECNGAHILSLVLTPDDPVRDANPEPFNITVDDYLKKSAWFKHRSKLWRTGVDFTPPTDEPEIPPYFLGVWLGDGSSRSPSVISADTEVADAWASYVVSLGLSVRKTGYPNGNKSSLYSAVARSGPGGIVGGNPLWKKLRRLRLLDNKHIPHRYLTGTKKERLELLAGLLDTDGSHCNNGYDFISVNLRIADGVVFLARSVGLAAYFTDCNKTCVNNGVAGQYRRVSISGDTSIIPCRIARKQARRRAQKKSVLRTGFIVEPMGEGRYHGFEIDSDGLFLLGDFTVTHNTRVFAHIVARTVERGKRIVVLVHRDELVQQVSEALTDVGVAHGIIAAGLHYDRRHHAHVASVATVYRRLDRVAVPDGVITDEAHHVIQATMHGKCLKFWRSMNPKLWTIGVTATPERLSGEGLGEMFDTMILGPTCRELIEAGWLSKYRLFAPETVDVSGLHRRAGDFVRGEVDELMSKPQIIGNVVSHYARICNGAPGVAFCPSVAHAEKTAERFRAAGFRAVSIDGTMSREVRRGIVADLRRGALNVLTSCDLISEGFDICALHAAMLLRPTQSLAMHLQMVGRALRISPGKDHAIILDHVGNTQRHGLPDADRQWTLEGRDAREAREKDGKLSNAVRQCLKCFAISPAAAAKCVSCGAAFPIKARKVDEVDGELAEIAVAHMKREAARAQGMAQDMDSLIALAKIRGYKNPFMWAQHVLRWREKKGRTVGRSRA